MCRTLMVFLFLSSCCAAQQPTSPPLTAEQQSLFDAAKKDFGDHRPDLALEKMKQLHAAVPQNPTITDGTAETALTVGEDAYALTLLKPWIASHADDWRAWEMLARAYAETGDAADRDRTIAAVVTLHETTADENFKQTDRFLVERVKLAAGALDIYYAIVPFSRYHIYMLGRQVDANNVLVQQITLESNDFDQPLFAQEHPDLTAKGVRRFSMDSYSVGKTSADGTATQTQALIGFMDGQPNYDDTKARMLTVANGKITPAATLGGIPVPKAN